MNRRRLLVRLAALAPAALAARSALAQTPFPQGQPVRIVVPFGAGSSTDILARELALRMAAPLGTSVIVVNQPGAGGAIGAQAVASSAADGHTLLMGTIGVLSMNEHLYPKLPYRVQRDFVPVIEVARTPNLLLVHPAVPARTLQEFVAHARAQQDTLSYGSPGNGTSPHLAGELFKARTGTRAVHVPYRGGVEALNDLVAGRLQFMFYHVTGAAPFVRDGRLRAVALGAPQRDPALPDLPTFAEAGIADFDVTAWIGLMAPAATPKTVLAALNIAAGQVLQDQAVRARFRELGAPAAGGSAQALGEHIERESRKWGELIRSVGIRIE